MELENLWASDAIPSGPEAIPTESSEKPAEVTPSETPAAEAKPADTAKEDEFTSKFSKLAKKEAELLAKQNELKNKESEFAQYTQLKSMAKDDPMAILDHFGVSIVELANYLSKKEEYEANPAIKETDKLKKEIQEMRAEAKRREEENLQSAQSKALNDFKATIKSTIEADSDTFDLINATDSHEMVYDVIRAHYDQTQKVMDTKEAAKLVEAHLEKELESKFAKSKKAGKFIKQPEAPKTEPQTLEQALSTSAPSKTLSSDMGTQASSPKPRSQMSDRERLEHATRWLK